MPPPRAERHLRLVPPLPVADPPPPGHASAAPRQEQPPFGVSSPPALPVHLLQGDKRNAQTARELAHAAWFRAGEVLGTDYSLPAFSIALRFLRRGQSVIGKGHPTTWAAAIVWMLAEDEHMIGVDGLTAAQLAGELGVHRKTLRARVPQLREVVGTRQPGIRVDDA